MVGLGKFTIPPFCKLRTNRRTFQPYLRCSHGCPYCYSMLNGMRWNMLYRKHKTIPFINFEQLEREFLDGGWFLYPASQELIFNVPSEKLWQTILREMGGKYATLSMIPEDLTWN